MPIRPTTQHMLELACNTPLPPSPAPSRRSSIARPSTDANQAPLALACSPPLPPSGSRRAAPRVALPEGSAPLCRLSQLALEEALRPPTDSRQIPPWDPSVWAAANGVAVGAAAALEASVAPAAPAAAAPTASAWQKAGAPVRLAARALGLVATWVARLILEAVPFVVFAAAIVPVAVAVLVGYPMGALAGGLRGQPTGQAAAAGAQRGYALATAIPERILARVDALIDAHFAAKTPA